MNSVAVIPVRFASTRFPGKPLAFLMGKPLVEHVYRRAQACKAVSRVIVATDDKRIFAAVQEFGGECMMTSLKHRTGSDRVGEVAGSIDADVIVNVQGDEPMIQPEVIGAVLEAMNTETPPAIVTAASPLSGPEEYNDPDVVKVVVDARGKALYFSRSSVPYRWTGGDAGLKHIGIYAYQKDALLDFVSLPMGRLERLEGLEQLRAIENGIGIEVVRVEGFAGIGIDSPDDLRKAERIMMEMAKVTGNTGVPGRGQA
ncbi:MAG TPA: 3-deoxy-manno-octulosonate cytidylyltransferase [Proteobacteria bacterium]|nr:3-deoxy-manno-octulosonate cytidylyltransferase [bacterium BMS3Abin14]HDL53746.1 3-deoxy-manno-octulosonate cytidylyltransferase [Pseudomonadota bacterium]